MAKKICTKCDIPKDLIEFAKDKNFKDGHTAQCLACRRKHLRIYRINNREKVLASSRLSYRNNKEYYRIYYRANKEKYPSQNSEYHKQHYQKIKEKKILQSRNYRQENKSILNEKSRIYKKKRRATDIAYNILIRLRGRLYKAIRGLDKSATTKTLLGCSPQELIEYLELKFTDGMSWDRLSEIHIDHIIPCASFDLIDPEQQRQCFHYTNLQPLWAEDNFKKGDRYGTS